MLNWLKRKKQVKLEHQLEMTDARLALMNAQLAAQMVRLAGQTNDLGPLKQAEEAILAARQYYTFETTPVEIGMVQSALGDMLLKLGRAKSDKAAVLRAREAFRSAITLASMHGDDAKRDALRDKVQIADSVLGNRPPIQSLFRVA